MVDQPLLICSVTTEGDHLVCACTSCGWVSPPARTGTECGAHWDDHMAVGHPPFRLAAVVDSLHGSRHVGRP